MAGSGEDHSRQRVQLLQKLWGKNKLDMFKEPRENQCSWTMEVVLIVIHQRENQRLGRRQRPTVWALASHGKEFRLKFNKKQLKSFTSESGILRSFWL